MKQFVKNVDLESRDSMIQYLSRHFRYNTMNSWNGQTSYAHNLKVHNLGLGAEDKDALYALLECENAYDDINDLLSAFGSRYAYRYQARFNGKSGGYLVLYQGESKDSEYKSRCTNCGQLNYKSVEENGCRCGRCGSEARVNLRAPIMNISVFGKGIDMHEDFEDWSDSELQERAKLIQEFDELAQRIVETALNMAKCYKVITEPYIIKKTRKVAVPG